MKMLQISRISFLTLFSLFRSPTSPPFNSISIGPLIVGGETKIVVDTDSSYLQFDVYIGNDKYTPKLIITETIKKAGIYTYTYDNKFTRTKNKMYIRYKASESGTVKTSLKYDFNVSGTSKTRYISDDETVTTTKTIGVFKSDLSFEEKNLTYSFEGFTDYYAPDYYQKIDLKSFKIFLDNKYHEFMCSSPSLVLANLDNVFSDIDGVDDYARFPLVLNDQGDYYTFDLAHTMYVNPSTLKMSSNPKTGYVQTEHVFLPVNEMQNQKNFGAYFALKSMGIDKDYWVRKFEIKASKNLFGDCHNSKYCVARVEE